MNQQDLINILSKEYFLSKVESEEILHTIFDTISESLQKNERAYFRNFGSFHKKILKSKKVRHPKTNQIITIPERSTVKFIPSKRLIDHI